MKNVIVTFTITLVAASLIQINTTHAVALENLCISRKVLNSLPISIYENPAYIAGPTSIDLPGMYVLAEQIDFSPSISGQACIIINSNNVILDLNTKAINLATENTQPESSGIVINSGFKNITIRNGTITNMTGYGIYISDGTDMIGLHELNINGGGIAGIICDGSATGTGISNISYNTIQIQNVSNLTENSAYGILLKYTSVSNFFNCTVNHITTQTGNCYGIRLENCTSSLLKNCISTENTGMGQQTIGFDVINSNPCLFFDCLASKNSCLGTGTDTNAIGFNYENSLNIFGNECTSVDNISSYTAYGFKFENCAHCKFESCQAFSNEGTAGSGIGFYSNQGSANEFDQCESDSNRGDTDGIGFALVGNETGSSIIESSIRMNLGTTGNSYGILLTATQCDISENIIVGHTAPLGGFGILDTTGDATGNSILSNVAKQNDTNYSPADPIIPIFSGPITPNTIPNPYQNVSL